MHTRFNRTLPLLAAIAAGVHCATFAQAVVNGSFELGFDPNSGPGQNIGMAAPDSSTIVGWTLSSGTIDYIGGRWAAADGGRSIDLNGVSAGTIFQTVSGFIPGVAYELHFMLAANPEGGSPTKEVVASIGNNSAKFDITRPELGASIVWSEKKLGFTASQPTMNLVFTSLNEGASGPALDSVRIVSAPEPGVCALTALAFASAGIFKTRRFKRP